MSRQGLRPLAVALSLLLLTALPTQANPVRFADVIAQAVTNDTGGRQTFDLRLRTLPQDARLSTSGAQTPTSNNPGNNDQTQTPTTGGNGSVTNTEVQTPTPGQSDNVETVQVGDVTGTVCDCGDIIVPGGHFPKLPFLALAGIPFLFIHHEDTPPPPGSTPTPPPQTPVPEPTTLLLLGSGLVAIGAGARRRRARAAVRALDLPSAGEV